MRLRERPVVDGKQALPRSASMLGRMPDPRSAGLPQLRGWTWSALTMLWLLWNGATAQSLLPLQGITQVAAGGAHTCALTESGGVKCWGGNGSGQLGDNTTTDRLTATDVVDGSDLISGVGAVATGGGHTCVLTDVGGVKCWGHNANGQLGTNSTATRLTATDVPGLTSGVSAIAASFTHTCALTSAGGVKCWGWNNFGQLGDNSTTQRVTAVDVFGLSSDVRAISAGSLHTCALTNAGGVKCWGANFDGRLGDNSTTQRLTAVDVVGLSDGVSAIATGGSHSCALTNTGAIKCWGANRLGQLGDNSTTNRLTAVDVSGLTSGVIAIAAGNAHTCALTDAGGVKCWGSNGSGELGDNSTTQRQIAVDVSDMSSGVSAISAGSSHTCAVTSAGGVKCWGTNFAGELGDNSTSTHRTAKDVWGLTSGVNGIAVGAVHACSLSSVGGVKCWGSNSNGQLGDNSTTGRLTAVDTSGLSGGVSAIATGRVHTCALTSAGGVKCWGSNSDGQLGDNTTAQRLTPVDVSGLGNGVSAIATGNHHSCALTSNGGVKCWGRNSSGQLGDNSLENRLTAVDVSGLTSGVSAIAAGNAHTCALTSAGGVKCWGENFNGELGDDSDIPRLTAVNVVGLNNGVSAIATGAHHSCALTTAGGIKCWGTNSSGQLGDNSFTNRLTAVDVSGLGSGVSAIAAGNSHSCALTSAGGVKCWGFNGSGQLGDDSTTQRLTAVDVSGLASGVSAIAAGGFSCALTSAGGVKCWGSNQTGQLGIGGRNYAVPDDVLVNAPARPVVDTLTPSSNQPSLEATVSGNGRYVVFESLDPALHAPCPEVSNPPLLCGMGGCPVTGPLYVFRVDTTQGCVDLVSVDDTGALIKMLPQQLGKGGGEEPLGKPSPSADGNLVAFVADDAAVGKLWGESDSSRAKRQKGGDFRILLRDILTGRTMSVGPSAPTGTDPASGQPINGGRPQVAPDGRSVVYTGLLDGKPTVMQARFNAAGGFDTFCVACKSAGGTDPSSFTLPLDGFAHNPTVSANGNMVAYQTLARDAAPADCDNGAGNTAIILRNLLTGTTRTVSQPQGTTCQSGSAGKPRMDYSGARLVFESTQPLTAGATPRREVYFFDAGSNRIEQISRSSSGQVDAPSGEPSISGDGRQIVFTSRARQGFGADLPANAPEVTHVVVKDMRSDTVRRLSENLDGAHADGDSFRPSLSYTGDVVAFDSVASNLSVADGNGMISDVFLRVNPQAAAVVFGNGFE